MRSPANKTGGQSEPLPGAGRATAPAGQPKGRMEKQ